jgi:single-strand DNA-binding protein
MAKSKTIKATTEETPPATQPSFLTYAHVELVGRLAADPDLRYTPKGTAVCRIRVATNDTGKAQFHDVVVWEELAEFAAVQFCKGNPVAVIGRLRNQTWKAADGSSRRSTEIVATAITTPLT